ncbi:hypothetical protein FRX31_021467 [Thalictrum thalictroides]|uniref:SKP1 component POZ domain-containing protein n=1 Tax=Thalictrum thalictroides TaxID=46969 RepID=A0A7J6VVU1_THATH|nr:hypothetical protein FRX31_021467 [Thalictrum thalictroides]
MVGSLAKTRKVKDLSINMEKVTIGRSNNNVILKSFDGDFFEVNENFVSESQIIQNMIAHNQSNEGVLLQNITVKTLAKVIEYYEKHFARTADHYLILS